MHSLLICGLTIRPLLSLQLIHPRQFLAAHFSVIDYCSDMPWADFPAVKTWYMKLKSRPCFRPLLTDRWPGLVASRHYDDLDF